MKDEFIPKLKSTPSFKNPNPTSNTNVPNYNPNTK